jgi:hypothetical protein
MDQGLDTGQRQGNLDPGPAPEGDRRGRLEEEATGGVGATVAGDGVDDNDGAA